MIIKSTRIATSSSRKRILDHVFRGIENDRVEILQGSEQDVADFWRDARDHGTPRAIRHWIVSPRQATSRRQAFRLLEMIAAEFGFDPKLATMVEHGKSRAIASALDTHWHILMGEVDTATGRVMSTSHDRPRHEFLSRLAEAEFGHPYVGGAHAKAVVARMRREGRFEIAEALTASSANRTKDKPQESFTTDQHQKAKRLGIDLVAVAKLVAVAWRSTTSSEDLTTMLSAHGLTIRRGNKDGAWIVESQGEFVGSLRRLAKARQADIINRMENIHDGGNRGKAQHSSDDPRRGSDTPAGGRNPPAIRGSAGTAPGRGRKFYGERSSSLLATSLGDGKDPRITGEPSQPNDRAGNRAGATSGDFGRVINSVATLTATMNATLIPRAEALAKSASTAALACLDAAEEHERATLITRVAEPSRDRVDLWAAEVANRGATMDTLTNQYAELSKKIGTLIMAEQARKRSLWQRFLPNQKAMDTLAKLKTQRAALWESRREAEGPYLSAMAAQSRAEKDLARAEVETKRARTENAATARLRLTAVSRARRIMTAWPAYAYCGALRLLQAGVRIEDAKRNGWDNAREIPTNLAP